jgi:hypothetical protein
MRRVNALSTAQHVYRPQRLVNDPFGRGGDEMLLDLIGLALAGLVAAALVWLVPRQASRAVGLLIFAVIANLVALIVTVAASFAPPSVYLDMEKNQLQFNRGELGELHGVMVKNPPVEWLVTEKNQPLWLAAGNLALTAVALVFMRRTAGTSSETPAS